MVERITVSPDPPTAGETLTICYDRVGEETSRKLEFNWTPAGLVPADVTIEFPPGCKDITVPSEATAIEIVDTQGDSEPYVSSVKPPEEGPGG